MERRDTSCRTSSYHGTQTAYIVPETQSAWVRIPTPVQVQSSSDEAIPPGFFTFNVENCILTQDLTSAHHFAYWLPPSSVTSTYLVTGRSAVSYPTRCPGPLCRGLSLARCLRGPLSLARCSLPVCQVRYGDFPYGRCLFVACFIKLTVLVFEAHHSCQSAL